MDNKIIEVLDHIGAKIGVAIDWTSENVLPHVTELMNRYAKYEIVSNSISAALCIAIIAASIIVLVSIYKATKCKYESIWIDYDNYLTAVGMFGIIFALAALIACSVFMFTDIFNIVGWAMVPEMKFFEMLSGYLG